MPPPADEPLDHWAQRRNHHRRSPGTLRALTLAPGLNASHINPQAPRLIMEWDGYTWVPVTVADNYAAAASILSTPAAPGPGRHRRT